MRGFWRCICVLALIVSAPAQAQSTSSGAAVANAISSPRCELHVFPAGLYYVAVEKWSEILGGGALGAVLDADFNTAKIKSKMKEYVSSDVQISELKKLQVARSLGLPDDSAIILEMPLISDGNVKTNPEIKPQALKLVEAEKKGSRLSASTESCYAELIMTNIRFEKSVLKPAKLVVAFWSRDFRTNGPAPSAVKSLVDTPVPGFPASSPEGEDGAKIAILAAFDNNFLKWVGNRKPSTKVN